MEPRAHYNHDLAEVQRRLLLLSEEVAQAIVQAMHALQRNDLGAARRIVAHDDAIDERRADLEDRALHLIAAQQPLATDLRFLVSVVRIADELERMGDYAEGIAALVLRAADAPHLAPPAALMQLSDAVQAMLQTSVRAFLDRDPDACIELELADDTVDELNREVRAAMLRQIQTEPGAATWALYYLFVAHNLERVADRAVNIAERTSFIATGGQPTHRRRPRE